MAISEEALRSYILQTAKESQISAPERRRGTRISTDLPGSIQSVHPLSNDRIDARVVDVSPRGMRLRVPTPLEPGIQIKVRLKTMIAFGEVRYCVKRGDQYYAGVQLHDVMENH